MLRSQNQDSEGPSVLEGQNRPVHVIFDFWSNDLCAAENNIKGEENDPTSSESLLS